ncbi:MAG TPA: 2-phosphosulfolactate phosphatase [Solirubrobacteraceae bacterium]
MAPRVSIDCFHEHLAPVSAQTAIVAIDVIRATTTATTAAAAGHTVYPAGSIEAAVRLAADLDRPLLAGELGGVQPYGFDLQNSPTQMLAVPPSDRPIILLSTSGTRLVSEAALRGTTYLACLRNVSAQADHLAAQERDVVILGADSRGEFRAEDQLCAARIADALVRHGYSAQGAVTETVLADWADAADDAFVGGPSSRYLEDTGQAEDLHFVLGHIDDLATVFTIEQGAVRAEPS